MEYPFVSIAIPFYNSEEFLLDSIRSVYAQTYPHWELILLDDGSSDGSVDVVKKIKDERVRVISDGQNKKLAARLNEVTRYAKYDYLVRMDADDLISPDRIQRQMDILLKDPSLDLVTTGVVSVLDDLSYVGHRGQDFDRVDLTELLNKSKGITHAALIAKKEWHQRNPYDESRKVAQDYTLWVRAAAKNDLKIRSLADPLYYYREAGNVRAKKMLLAYGYERELFLQYGGSRRWKLYFKSLMKSCTVRLLTALGKMDLLLSKRGTGTNEDRVRTQLNSDLERIKNTSIPGIDA